MRIIKVVGLFAALLLAMNCIVTPALACPKGYVRCGGACCPTH
jgi:hypothetical protein